MSDDDLLKEFEQDMRKERSDAMWKSFGKYVVWLSIAIVLGTASGVSWRYWQKTEGMKQTSQLIKGREFAVAGDYKKAAMVLGELALSGDENIKGLALLRQAQALQKGGETEKAKAVYAQLSAMPGNSNVAYAAVAAIKEGAILPEAKKNLPFYFSQMEWRGWQLVDKGETKKAVEIFTSLLDDGQTPMSIRGRVTEGLQMLAPETLLPKIAADEPSNEK